MPRQLNNTLTIVGGTGVTASNSGIGWDGVFPVTQELDVGQDIGTTDNVQFNHLTASSGYILGSTSVVENSWNSDFTVTGNMGITGNLTVPGNATVGGTIIAEEIISELTSSAAIFKSGSSLFGDTIDDTHYFTGSIRNSGSTEINGYSINEISNDDTMVDSSATALVTENALKSYADSELGTLGDPTSTDLYLRKRFTKTVSSVSNNTASFTAVTASAPAGMTLTGEDDFIFFIDGNVMEHDALTIEQSGSTFLLKVDPNSIGYVLESDDEIIAMGKFNA